MIANYSHLRMTNFQWVEQQMISMGKTEFFKLFDKYYAWLLSQKPGWVFNLTISKVLKTEADRDLFIKTVQLFISEKHGDYEFSEDFTILRRI